MLIPLDRPWQRESAPTGYLQLLYLLRMICS